MIVIYINKYILFNKIIQNIVHFGFLLLLLVLALLLLILLLLF